MKKWQVVVSVCGVLCLLLATGSAAQQGIKWRGGRGWGAGSAYCRMFDVQTVDTLSAEVVRVESITPMKGMSYGVHLVVRVAQETLSVHLGPAWYIENQDTEIGAKDSIDIVGSRITFGGEPVIIAAEVRKGDEVLKLRDKNGVPIWSGWRRR